MIDDAFGLVLKRLRANKSLSQEALAHKAGFHRTYISQLERGLKSPSLKTLYRLSRVLDVGLDELMRLTQAEMERKESL